MVRINALRPSRIADPVLEQAHRDVRQAIRQVQALSDGEILQGRHIGDTTLTNGSTNKVLHKLNRKLKGYIVTDLRGASATGRIVRLLSSGGLYSDDATDLWLDVQGWGANIICRFWVY